MKRLVLSFFLVFHLFGVFTTPNFRSYLVIALAPIYRPYMNTLNLAHAWGFFAPDPVFPPMHFDFTITAKDGQETKGRFPEDTPPFFRDHQNRIMSMSSQISASPDKLKNMLIPYLCRRYEGAEHVKLWRLTGSLPSFEEVKSGQKKMTETVDYRIDVLGEFFCEEAHAVTAS